MANKSRCKCFIVFVLGNAGRQLQFSDLHLRPFLAGIALVQIFKGDSRWIFK